MARIGVGTLDELYNPALNQAIGVRIDEAPVLSYFHAATADSICSASSGYDTTWLKFYTDIAPRNDENQRDWLEDLESEENSRKTFWERTNAAYAALRTDPKAWQEEQAERRLWDSTLADGLEEE